MWDKAKKFFSEVATELKKVSWPSRKETVNLTMVVILLMMILGIFLAVVDGILAKIVSKILGA